MTAGRWLRQNWKMGPPEKVLDRTCQLQLLMDPAFFDACPEFNPLKESALSAADVYRELLATGHCLNCGDGRIMDIVREAFLEQLAGMDDAQREPVRAFVADKLGYRPKTLIIYLRDP